MNKIDFEPSYKKIYNIVKEKFDRTKHFNYGPFDETYYTMRVYESAKEIIKYVHRPVKVQQILTAAILHDIGKIKLMPSKLFAKDHLLEDAGAEWRKHPALGVPIAKKILKQLGHSDEFISDVCYLIANHDQRAEKMDNRTVELAILQDADLIADIGMAGFLRPFLFSGKFSRSINASIRYIKNEDRTVNKSGRSEINLAISKKLAKREMKIQKQLAKEVYREIRSDLLDN